MSEATPPVSPAFEQILHELHALRMANAGTDHDWQLLAWMANDELIKRSFLTVSISGLAVDAQSVFPVVRQYISPTSLCLNLDKSVIVMLPSQVESLRNAPETATQQIVRELRAAGSRRVDDAEQYESEVVTQSAIEGKHPAEVLISRCEEVFREAAKTLGNDLRGGSIRDLCADNIPDVPLSQLEDAIIASDIINNCSPRIRERIEKMAQEKREDELK